MNVRSKHGKIPGGQTCPKNVFAEHGKQKWFHIGIIRYKIKKGKISHKN